MTPKQRPGRDKPNFAVYQSILKQFVGCIHCGTFLAGYRVLHGVAALEKGLKEGEQGQINLRWDTAVYDLFRKSYNLSAEPDTIYFDLICPECQRRFTWERLGEGTDEAPPTYRFQVSL